MLVFYCEKGTGYELEVKRYKARQSIVIWVFSKMREYTSRGLLNVIFSKRWWEWVMWRFYYINPKLYGNRCARDFVFYCVSLRNSLLLLFRLFLKTFVNFFIAFVPLRPIIVVIIIANKTHPCTQVSINFHKKIKQNILSTKSLSTHEWAFRFLNFHFIYFVWVSLYRHGTLAHLIYYYFRLAQTCTHRHTNSIITSVSLPSILSPNQTSDANI